MLSISKLNYTSKSGKHILHDVDGDIPLHEFTAILGANGAGKSTLLKCMANELFFQTGSIQWMQQEISKMQVYERSQSIAILRQQYQVNLPFTAFDIIEMAAYHKNNKHTKNQIFKLINEVASYVGIQHLLDRLYPSLSGGEQQRVQLARVLLQLWISPSKEKLLLLDEPVSALDIQYQHQFMQLMQYLVKEKQFTIITVLHDLNLAAQYVDHVLLLHEGTKLKQGTPIETLTPKNLETLYHIPFNVILNEAEQIQINVPKLNSLFNNINKN